MDLKKSTFSLAHSLLVPSLLSLLVVQSLLVKNGIALAPYPVVFGRGIANKHGTCPIGLSPDIRMELVLACECVNFVLALLLCWLVVFFPFISF